MTTAPVRGVPSDDVRAGLAEIRRELDLPDAFPPEVLAVAEAAAFRLPEVLADPSRVDLRDVPFVTIDPPGSEDLDQAVAIRRQPDGGFLIRYAIADVGAFVQPGDAVDEEARRRGVTVYLPDGRVPLHPEPLSEGAASLLPGADRPALAWEISLDAAGVLLEASMRRAVVRSRAQLTYAEAQEAADRGASLAGTDIAAQLGAVGTVLLQREADRGGATLPVPDQEVDAGGDRFHLVYRAPLPAERWNAQVSLLAGRAAAQLMLDAGGGIVRTLPPPDGDALSTFMREAEALGVTWPAGATYADVIRTLDPAVHRHAALLVQATRLFRGAGYEAFSGSDPPHHAAVAAPYAHVTAPLRRLVDRFANEIVLAHCEGRPAGPWAVDALADLPELMSRARSLAGSANRMAIDLMEAAVLARRRGQPLEGTVVDLRRGVARVQLVDPAVVADIDPAGDLPLGAPVRVEVADADVAARRVRLRLL